MNEGSYPEKPGGRGKKSPRGPETLGSQKLLLVQLDSRVCEGREERKWGEEPAGKGKLRPGQEQTRRGSLDHGLRPAG